MERDGCVEGVGVCRRCAGRCEGRCEERCAGRCENGWARRHDALCTELRVEEALDVRRDDVERLDRVQVLTCVAFCVEGFELCCEEVPARNVARRVSSCVSTLVFSWDVMTSSDSTVFSPARLGSSFD